MNIDGKTGVLGLIGDPVEHTLSPIIHNTLSDILNINNTYVPFHTKSENLKRAVDGAFAMNIKGLNITVPHKNSVIDCLVKIDEGAEAIGAVNTLVRDEDGYKGYNTDMMGLYREITNYGVELSNSKVIILGAGGAAKAVSYMCMKYGAKKIYLLNRSLDKAQAIATHLNNIFDKNIISPRSLNDYEDLMEKYNSYKEKYIVFQSTSIGLSPHDDQVIIEDKNFYKMVLVGIDLIYNPFITKFMRLCEEAGAKSYNGLKMLLYQGIIAYELWNKISVDEKTADFIYSKMLKKIKKNIILIGFMGSGKTTVGQNLCEITRYKMIDTDSYIEEKEGCTISEIFSNKGETYFRELETRILEELNEKLDHCIISTGGGLPLREENAQALSKLGTVFYLKIDGASVFKRLKGDTTRPLLAGDNPEKKIEALLQARDPIYSKASDVIIEVCNKKPYDIAREISEKEGIRLG